MASKGSHVLGCALLHPMPRKRNEQLYNQWNLLHCDFDPQKVYSLHLKLIMKCKYACKHCFKVLYGNATHLKEHLKKCRKFLKQMSQKKKTDDSLHQFIFIESSQTQLNFPRLSSEQKNDLDIQAAMWCFMGNYPFILFENPFTKAFIHSLNPVYKPSLRKMLAGSLLNTVYQEVKIYTENLIATFPNINVITDKSTNINTARICNISIHSAYGSFHYLSKDIEATQMTSLTSGQWLRTHLDNLSNGNLT